MLIIHILLLILGFFLLVKGADYLVEGSAATARKYHISEIVIGLTLVSFGTSFPELIVNIIAALKHENDLVLGNVIGSNIFNTAAILGIAGLFAPMAVHLRTFRYEIPFSVFITLLLPAMGMGWLGTGSGLLSTVDALILLMLFAAYLYYIFYFMKKDRQILIKLAETIEVPPFSGLKTVLYIIGGIIAVVWGGKLVVDNAVVLAESWGVSRKLISITIISAGTSLPELATSLVAALKRKSDLAIGNIVGSNIFNILLVLGSSAAIRPIAYSRGFNLDILFFLGILLLLFAMLLMGKNKELKKKESLVLLLLFFSYMIWLFIREGILLPGVMKSLS